MAGRLRDSQAHQGRGEVRPCGREARGGSGLGQLVRGRGGGRLPFVAQEHVVEVVVDNEQLLGELLVSDSGDELQDPLLHGPACAVELLRREEERWPRPPGPEGGSHWGPGSSLCAISGDGGASKPDSKLRRMDGRRGSTDTLWILPSRS